MIIRDKKKSGELTFVCHANPKAKSVYLAGSFNGWEPAKQRMVKSRDGTFRAKVKLPPGKYEYKFIADGVWVDDSDAEIKEVNQFGTTNSVVEIS